jgi:hypothetical protein
MNQLFDRPVAKKGSQCGNLHMLHVGTMSPFRPDMSGTWAPLGASFRQQASTLGPTSARLGSNMPQLGPTLRNLGPSWASLGGSPGRSWGPTRVNFADSMRHAENLHFWRYFPHLLASMGVRAGPCWSQLRRQLLPAFHALQPSLQCTKANFKKPLQKHTAIKTF